jgi:site-specific recombinase XerD
MPNPRLIVKFDDWPPRDRSAWLSLFREGHILAEPGPGGNWSAGTRAKFEQSYGHWLGYLARTAELDTDCAPADRFTSKAVQAFYEDTRARISFISTSTQVTDLFSIARALDPARDWSWFKRVADRLRRDPAHRQLRPRPGISSSEVYDWALSEIEAAKQMPDEDSWERPIRFRDGLMVGLLIGRPVRLRSFIGMTVDRHLVGYNGGYDLHFRPEDMKDRKAREYSVPCDLVTPMHRYLADFRPRLLAGNETAMLWVSRRKGPLSYEGFHCHLWNITSRAFGQGLRPHAFRHIAATSIAEEDPVHVNIIASVLGHATLTMSERHYNLATGVRAAGAWQDLVHDRRKTAARNARMRRRIDNYLGGDSHPHEDMEE